MSAAVGAAVRELPGYRAGREAERADVIAYIKDRGRSALVMGSKGHQITEAEGARLDRWLGALAGDIAAELHEGGD